MFRQLGTKLKLLRESLGLTQEELGQAVGLSSEFISFLEIGKRNPSLESLKKLAEYFRRDISLFLDSPDRGFENFLEAMGPDAKTRAALKKFQRFCRDTIVLENLLDRRIEPAPVYYSRSATRMAEEERGRLGLGTEPVADIVSLVEAGGLHVARLRMPPESKIAGLFHYARSEEASFALIDAAQPAERQRFAVAHLYGHYLKDRFIGTVAVNPDMFIADYVSLYHPRERFAHKFASRFLMPPGSLRRLIAKEWGVSQPSYGEVLFLKRYFGVSTFAMLQTLRDLGLLSSFLFNEFKNKNSEGFEKTLFGSVKGGETVSPRGSRLIVSDRFRRLALEGLRRKKIDEKTWPRALSRELSALRALDKDGS